MCFKNKGGKFMFKKITITGIMVLGCMIILLISGCSDPELYEIIENFNAGNAGNFIDDGTGNMSVVDMEYRMTGQGLDDWSYSYYNRLFADFLFSVDVKQTSGNSSYAYGMYFRSPSGNLTENSYVFGISSSGYWFLGKFVDGEVTYIHYWDTSENFNIGLNVTNTLKVVCAGDYITVYINGVSEVTYTDTSFTSGFCGVGGFDHSSYSNIFTYDNFFISME